MLVALPFVIYLQIQTHNFARRVGKVMLYLHNREYSCVFYGEEMQNVIETKEKRKSHKAKSDCISEGQYT